MGKRVVVNAAVPQPPPTLPDTSPAGSDITMIGEHEPVTRPIRAISRAEHLVRRIETVLVSNAGHMLTAEAPEQANAKVAEFLNRAT